MQDFAGTVQAWQNLLQETGLSTLLTTTQGKLKEMSARDLERVLHEHRQGAGQDQSGRESFVRS